MQVKDKFPIAEFASAIFYLFSIFLTFKLNILQSISK